MARDCPQANQKEKAHHAPPVAGNFCDGEYVEDNKGIVSNFIDTHIHWEYVTTVASTN